MSSGFSSAVFLFFSGFIFNFVYFFACIGGKFKILMIRITEVFFKARCDEGVNFSGYIIGFAGINKVTVVFNGNVINIGKFDM